MPTDEREAGSVDEAPSQDDAWAEHAPSWDHDPAVVAYADAAWRSLQAAVALGPTTRALDFGCGTGLLTERMAPRVGEIVAVDASAAMIEVLAAKQRASPLANVRCAVARWTPETIAGDELAAEPFDLVVCSSVCAFLDDYPAVVAMLAGRLAAGGHFVQWDWELDPGAEEPFGLSRDVISSALTSAGLTVVSLGIGFDIPFEDKRMRPLMGIGRRPASGVPASATPAPR